MVEGFIPVARRFFSHEFWEEKRVYSRAEAWIDLVRSASWENGRRVVKGKSIPLERGEQIASLRFLGSRWRWSAMKVNRFLNSLENETMIKRETRQGESVVSLCKFETYNTNGTMDETGTRRKARQKRDSDETVTRQSKEGKEVSPKGDTVRPEKADLIAHVVTQLGMTENDAEHVWSVWEENDWTRSQAGKRVPIKNWKMALATWKTGLYFPSQKNNGRNAAGTAVASRPKTPRLITPEQFADFLADDDNAGYRRLAANPPVTFDDLPPSRQNGLGELGAQEQIMKLTEATPGTRVKYIPIQAKGSIRHPDVQSGVVTSANEGFAFVVFDKAVERLGIDSATPAACWPAYLLLE